MNHTPAQLLSDPQRRTGTLHSLKLVQLLAELFGERSSTLRIILMDIVDVVGFAQAVPVQAQFLPPGHYDRMDLEGINEPYVPRRAINFEDLLASTQADARTLSYQSSRQFHRTQTQELRDVTDVFRAAIPAGTSATEATAKLRKAGADCAKPKATQHVCHYYLPDNPDDPTYSNSARWQVYFEVGNGKVTNVAVIWR